MKEPKPSVSQKQSKGTSKADDEPDDRPVQSDDPKECLRRLTTILAVLAENPAKRENAVRVINGNILQLKKLTVKSEKKQDAALILKMHESALGLIKRLENLEWKVSAQDKALSEEDHLGTELVTSIVDMEELEDLKKDYEKLKQDYDIILQKKGELSKDLVETQEKLEKTAKELNIMKHEMNNAYVPMEQHAAELSVIEARYASDLAQKYIKREDTGHTDNDFQKLKEENSQLAEKVKELLNDLETMREEAISDIREWYLLQLKKYRGTFDHLVDEKESLSNLLKEEVEKRQKVELQLTEYLQKIERGVFLPKDKIDSEVKRLTDATREAEEKRKEAENLQSRLKDDIVRLHMLEKDIQEKDAQIQWLKAKIGDDKISHDSELQEIEAEYNQRIKELEKGFESKSLREREAMTTEIERLKREMTSILQTTRQQIKKP